MPSSGQKGRFRGRHGKASRKNSKRSRKNCKAANFYGMLFCCQAERQRLAKAVFTFYFNPAICQYFVTDLTNRAGSVETKPFLRKTRPSKPRSARKCNEKTTFRAKNVTTYAHYRLQYVILRKNKPIICSSVLHYGKPVRHIHILQKSWRCTICPHPPADALAKRL